MVSSTPINSKYFKLSWYSGLLKSCMNIIVYLWDNLSQIDEHATLALPSIKMTSYGPNSIGDSMYVLNSS